MPEEKKVLTVGVIGLGHWGPNIVRNLVGHPRVSLRYVCDIDPAGRQRVASLVPASCRPVAEAGQMLDDSALEAVVIVTPASTHYKMTARALRAGKHVLCEKPLTLSAGEGDDLCRLAQERGLRLMTGFTFLFNESVHYLKKRVTSGNLGQLYYITASRTHLGLVRSDVSVLWDLAPHDVAIANYLLDQVPVRVSAVGMNPLSRHPDAAFLSLFYPAGVMAQIHVSWIDANKERRFVVVGSKARAVFNDLDNLEPIRLYHKGLDKVALMASDYGEFRFLQRDGDIVSPRVEMKEPLKNMLNAFVDLVLEGAPNPASGRCGVEVTRTLEAAHRSLEAYGAPVEVSSRPQPETATQIQLAPGERPPI